MRKRIQIDSFHPNEVGHRCAAEAMAKAILYGAPEGSQETTGVLGRTEQMCGFHDRRQFVGWYKGHVPGAFAANNDHFLLRRNTIQHRCKLIAKLGVGSLHLYFASSSIVQGSCTYSVAAW